MSFEEYKTSTYVADLLASFGHIEILRPTKTSVVGILRGGKPEMCIRDRGHISTTIMICPVQRYCFGKNGNVAWVPKVC